MHGVSGCCGQPLRLIALGLSIGLAVSPGLGCRTPLAEPAGVASDEWTRSYPLEPGGELQVTNRDGSIEITATDDDRVHVRVERTVRAPTDEVAKNLLRELEIREDVGPGRVELQTARPDGILVGVSWELHYRVRAPRASTVRIRSSNGAVNVSGFSGRVIAASSNGVVTATGLAGGAEIRSTNGEVHAAFTHVGPDLIEIRATNAGVRVQLPPDADANLLASSTNGVVELKGVVLQPMGEQSARRVRGRIGAGGTPIELSVTNDSITVTSSTPEP